MQVKCYVCGQGGAGDSPPYSCHRCGGYKTMVPYRVKVCPTLSPSDPEILEKIKELVRNGSGYAIDYTSTQKETH